MLLRRPTRLMLAATALAAAFTVGSATGVVGASADTVTTTTADGITVAGVGSVSGTPDVLRMSLRVVVVRPDASTALRDANTVTARIKGQLRNHGVAAADLQTTQLSVNPSYAGKPAHVVGYQVVQGLAAQLRDLSTAGATITDAITAGGTYLRFDGVYFVLSDDSPLKVQARQRAFAQAKAKADQYAQLSGRSLGAVQSISEDVQPAFYDGGGSGGFASAAAAPAALSFDPGTQQVDVHVVVRWALV
jgi:uncharacterized protein YggE